MLTNYLPSKKLAALLATMGLAGIAGVCGCKTSRTETGCCKVCAPVAAYQTAAPNVQAPEQPDPGAGQDVEPPAAPPADASTTPAPYEEPAPTSAETAARFKALGGTVESDAAGDVSVLDLSGTTAGDADLREGAGLEQLTQLDLSNTNITDAALAHPQWMSLLTRLSLNGTGITDAGLQNLKNLHRLQLLWLNETAVSDAGLAHLAGLTGLQSLGLNKTEMTDAGLAHLRNMRELKYLLLGHTQITDAGLQHLRGLTKLKGLSLVGTRVTPVGIAELQAALPNCRIVADPVKDAATDDADENSDTEESVNENDAGPETGEVPRRLDSSGPTVSQAVSMSAPQLPLPARRFPGFALHGAAADASAADITRYYLGVALAETGDMRAAMPLFVETVGEAAAYYNIGVMLCKAGYWKQGESQFHTALDLDPDMPAARRWLREIEQERATVLPTTARPEKIQNTSVLRPVQIKSQRRTDMVPPPIGVWTNF